MTKKGRKTKDKLKDLDIEKEIKIADEKSEEKPTKKAKKEVGLKDEEIETNGKRKVIYIEIDDEVSSVYNKIKNVTSKEIYVVAPKRSTIFQSIVNLKILRRKAKEENKKISFITNDKKGTHLAKQAGIDVFDKIGHEGKPVLFSTDNVDEKLRITPLRATVNSIDDDAPTRVSERKVSISEILKKGKKTALNLSHLSPRKKKVNNRPKFVLVAPNRHALIGLISVSVIILLMVIYIALPGATIFLTPTASVLEKSVNITLADYQQNRSELETQPQHLIASYPIDVTVERSITHYATGKRLSELGSNASGTITIINTSENLWPLVAQTRFQTSEGIVFRISAAMSIPPATSAGPGKADAYVLADTVDSYGGIVGELGNIEPTRFFLPGLKESSQSKLYAESYAPMTGGITDFVSYISEEDVLAAESRLKDELIKGALEELRTAVDDKGTLVDNAAVYTLLEGEGAVRTGEPYTNVPSDLSGREISEFEVSGTVYVSGVYYEHDNMLQILKDELLLKKSPQKELLRVNEDSTSYRIFEWDDARGKIKLTANIKGIEQYTIDPEKENGVRLLQNIKDHIVGREREDAKVYIQNLPEINKVEIDSWPAWSPTIPNIPDNIDFEIRPAVTLQ